MKVEKSVVKVYLKGKDGEEGGFITTINLSEEKAHKYYLGKWWNMGIETDKMMKCYMVDTIPIIKDIKKI
jgi:hypothetical protein